MRLGPMLSIPVEAGHYVYRHVDADSLVLYVGRTSNPTQRTAAHIANRRRTTWWPQVLSIEWERFETAGEAVRREWEQIESLRTPHNFLPRALRSTGAA